jgi:hypothetical protein
LADWTHEPSTTSEFVATGLDASEPRLLQFVHLEKRLAGSLVVRGDEKGPLTVKLGPAGTATGRLVTSEGKPEPGGAIVAFLGDSFTQDGLIRAPRNAGSLPRPIRPDKDGKFRIEGLVPGLTYDLSILKGGYLLPLSSDKLTIKAGETKNLGDVQVKLME